MAKRRMSDYSSFVSARMRALAPSNQAEARAAMRQCAAEWRTMKTHRSNPSEVAAPALNRESSNPRRLRRRSRRSNPGGSGLWTLALIGLGLYVLARRGTPMAPPVVAAPTATPTTPPPPTGSHGW